MLGEDVVDKMTKVKDVKIVTYTWLWVLNIHYLRMLQRRLIHHFTFSNKKKQLFLKHLV